MIGRTISHYKIVSKLGEGGMGIVYKAEDTKLKRAVALKFLRSDVIEDPEHRERFLREAQAAAALDHPNICTVYEIDEVDGQTFISRAFLEGQTVKQKVKERPLKLDQALDIAGQTARGLQAAHGKDIVHRDIKSANLMVTAQSHVRIMDFGLARLADRSQLTKTDARLGTPAYMSPEQVQGKEADQRSDIWSLGVVLYQMVSGRLPFAGEVEAAVTYGILNEQPEPVTALRSGVPIELDRLLDKAMAKDPAERYQHVEEMLVDMRALAKRGAAGGPSLVPPPPPDRRLRPGAILVGFAVGAIMAGGSAYLFTSRGTSPPAPDYTLRRLTYDSGLTYQPTVSADGDLVAYAADRASEGNLDIWVQQVGGGGEPVPLTHHPADDHEPHFSPDGKSIVFRSARGEGGIYIMPALGGDERLLVPRGRRPLFSPDGSLVSYHTGTGDEGSRIGIVPLPDGKPIELQPDFRGAGWPIWTPDGKHLLFRGFPEGSDWDWWVSPIDGGPAVATHARAALDRSGLTEAQTRVNLWRPEIWQPNSDHVLFSAKSGDARSIWRIPISPTTWQAEGGPTRLSHGANDVHPSMTAAGALCFAAVERNVDIWALPLSANQARPTGEMYRLTTSPAHDFSPAISRLGRTLVFLSDRAGAVDLWVQDLMTGQARRLTQTPSVEAIPTISADDTTVAYTVYLDREGMSSSLRLQASAGGVHQEVCKNCGAVAAWSSDGRLLVGQPFRIVDPITGTDLDILGSPNEPFYESSFSPDDRWVVFHKLIAADRTQIYAAPPERMAEDGEESWIPITEGKAMDDKPRWSPDGNLIYFTSDRDGFTCLWAQRLDPATKQPSGAAIDLRHFHQASLSLEEVTLWIREISVARDKIVMPLAQLSGNIWLMEPRERAED